MAGIRVRTEDVQLSEPTLLEGLPGVGLVGKIATEHLIDEFDMVHYASVRCEGLPRLGVYQQGDRAVKPPVRIYADEAHDLLALSSDVPISASIATNFARCVTDWLTDEDVLPIYVSGLPTEEKQTPPASYGVATGSTGSLLDEIDVGVPQQDGGISGPTGALLHEAADRGADSVGAIVQSDPRFPDPEAASVIIETVLEPLADVDIDVDALREQAAEIREQRQALAEQLQSADVDESTQAKPLRMFQ
jgi:uncharacterized protein